MSKPTKHYERPVLEVIHLQHRVALLNEGMSSGEAAAPGYDPDED